MPPKSFKNRSHNLYFSSEAELRDWNKAAIEGGLPLSKFILEMANRGRTEKRQTPLSEIETRNSEKEELRNLKDQLITKSKLIDSLETQLWKAKHAKFAIDNFQGLRPLNAELIKLLKAGGTYPGHEILELLHIDPTDSQAAKILYGQLLDLASVDLVRETANGWKWIN